ncbi:MAG: VOC family protein [Paracoccus sp. (in: a-proteobacteria)]|uniref:VOC family protein n=1 Tax=Paracoccus sp. TaxID=267 RepID=UPI0026E087A7|nr:VOC family protein [Paracoccus sp. (in: a-proteobacteria)]MDO5632763.1 VOC family protein [Paracoccus sp. (in: a-proteobacteria)]
MTTSDAPVSVSHVALTVRDLPRTGDFYRRVLGLNDLTSDGDSLTLGQGDTRLLELRRDPDARPQPRGAGLFHTAFLLPHRDDLGRWLRHAVALDLRLDGASDHLVSEAVYLRDPEGNGIEIYADRPRSSWKTDGVRVQMDTVALDVPGLMRAPGDWTAAPDGTVIGHVHLQVGDIPQAEAFYAGELGFDLTSQINGASFYATGGYHHHLATNIWNSRGAGPRGADTAGLAELVLSADADSIARLGRREWHDPWGNRVVVASRAA